MDGKGEGAGRTRKRKRKKEGLSNDMTKHDKISQEVQNCSDKHFDHKKAKSLPTTTFHGLETIKIVAWAPMPRTPLDSS